jgi:hypothetical protein
LNPETLKYEAECWRWPTISATPHDFILTKGYNTVNRKPEKKLKKEFSNLYFSPSINRVITSRRIRWTGHIACMGKIRETRRSSVGKPERKRQLGKNRCTWEDNYIYIYRGKMILL